MAGMYLNRAIAEAARLEMEKDENVILIGEDIINRGGGLSIFLGIPEQYPERCFDMPIAETGFSNWAIGASVAGARPIVDLMFSDFTAVCADALINNASKVRFTTLGTQNAPVVFIAGNGGRGTYGGVGSGCNHSQCAESWYTNVPGLKIVAPYYADDALGLLRASIRDDDPVLFLYHLGSVGKRADVPEDHYVPINNAARIRKEGSDVTIVAIQSMVPIAEGAAVELEKDGISAEVIDPRVLVPFDEAALMKSVNKTGRLVIVHEAPTRGGFGGEIAAIAADKCHSSLKAPIKRIGSLNSPIPCGFGESMMVPHVEDVVAVVKSIMK